MVQIMRTQEKRIDRTIFAAASAIGDSGISVIRISGPETFNILSKIFSKSSSAFLPVDFESANSHTLHHGYLISGNNETYLEIIDEVIVSIFKGPNSFTGDDVAEISTHGGLYIFRKINSLLTKLGISQAEPGEFSKRAYLNGKLDLAQAEAISDLIRAKTDMANKIAMKQLSGEFSYKINELKVDLINYCSLLELELDFSEEGLELVSRAQLLEKIDKIIDKFQSVTRSYESGKIIKEGINLAIVGKPNVGKSSIFNYLLKQNRAIVSDIPGTTRDYLQEPLIMDGIVFNLIDTAGIRESGDAIETEGVKRSREKIDESDIVLEIKVKDKSDSNDSIYAAIIPTEKIILAFNKSDLSDIQSNGHLSISAKTGNNMEMLQNSIVKMANKLIKIDNSSAIIITNERHRNCMLKSCEYLVNAKKQINIGGGNELISFEIREAMQALSEIMGKTTNVDILNNIFMEFCIGK